MIPAIQQLRRQCGQEDDLTTDPEYFIAANALNDRSVAAVLIRKDHELEACVLFYEHCKFGLSLGLLRGGDAVGEGLVAGPGAFRLQYVHLATQSLLRHYRIHGVKLAVNAPLDCCVDIMGPQDKHRIFAACDFKRKLPLPGDYRAMLAAMGPRTRRSLAGKRQQLETRAHVAFLPCLDPAEALEAMQRLGARSRPHRSAGFYRARSRLLGAHPDFFCMGLRLPEGAWLSVLSGWRRDRVTYVDLQMNDMYSKKESISAVMRAFMLEHEIVAKQQLINFVGGTSLLLRRYCQPIEHSTYVSLWRPGLRTTLLKMILPHIKPESFYERTRMGTGRE